MEGSSTLFKYLPLDEPDSIRLLILHPGPPQTAICCDLIHTTLTECREDIYDHYTALSYVWGNPKDTSTILLNGQPFQVTANLASALKDLRDERKYLRLWVDALCIDQRNVLERNEQVKYMSDIYSLANQTVAYLGESNGQIDEVFRVIQANENENLVATNSAASRSQITSMQGIVTADVLTRPWFDRVWIYQELVLSNVVWVQCGRRRVHWDSLYKFLPELPTSMHSDVSLGAVSHNVTTPSVTSRRLELVAHMHKTRQNYKSNIILEKSSVPLLEILLARRGFGVTDPKDMIYGHMAVARLHDSKVSRQRVLPLSIDEVISSKFEKQEEFFRIIQDPIYDLNYSAYLEACQGLVPCFPVPTVDYTKSISEVFTDAMRFILDVDQSLHALLHAGPIDPSARRNEVPSWVPDWTLSKSHYPMPLHSCSSPIEAPPMITFAFCKIAPILVSIGTIRGTLSTLSPTIKAYDEELDKEEEFHAFSRKSIAESGGQIGYSGGSDPEREDLFRQVYETWRRKLGDVRLPPYQNPHIYSTICDSFNWVNSQGMPKHNPSLMVQSYLQSRLKQTSIRDISLEEMLMKHPFSIFPNKPLTGRKVAMYNDRFLDGYCVVPADSQPGDVLCYLRDPLSPLVVLRPVPESQREEMAGIVEKNWKENTPPVWFRENLDPYYFTYVGEAWIQKTSTNIMRLESAHFQNKLIVLG